MIFLIDLDLRYDWCGGTKQALSLPTDTCLECQKQVDRVIHGCRGWRMEGKMCGSKQQQGNKTMQHDWYVEKKLPILKRNVWNIFSPQINHAMDCNRFFVESLVCSWQSKVTIFWMLTWIFYIHPTRFSLRKVNPRCQHTRKYWRRGGDRREEIIEQHSVSDETDRTNNIDTAWEENMGASNVEQTGCHVVVDVVGIVVVVVVIMVWSCFVVNNLVVLKISGVLGSRVYL